MIESTNRWMQLLFVHLSFVSNLRNCLVIWRECVCAYHVSILVCLYTCLNKCLKRHGTSETDICHHYQILQSTFWNSWNCILRCRLNGHSPQIYKIGLAEPFQLSYYPSSPFDLWPEDCRNMHQWSFWLCSITNRLLHRQMDGCRMNEGNERFQRVKYYNVIVTAYSLEWWKQLWFYAICTRETGNANAIETLL